MTASGRSALGQLRSAAVDRSVYPGGALFRIKELPWLYVVDHDGSALVGTGTNEIYHPEMEDMKQWGRRNVEVTVVRWESPRQSAGVLSGRQRHARCRQMVDAILRKGGEIRRFACRWPEHPAGWRFPGAGRGPLDCKLDTVQPIP